MLGVVRNLEEQVQALGGRDVVGVDHAGEHEYFAGDALDGRCGVELSELVSERASVVESSLRRTASSSRRSEKERVSSLGSELSVST